MAIITKTNVPLRKVTKNWYRLTLALDQFDCVKSAIDVIRTEFGDWLVVDEMNLEFATRANRTNHSIHFTFCNLRTAKAFAHDLRAYIESDYTPALEPKIYYDKYCDME